MPNQINIWLGGYIKALSEEKYSYFCIAERWTNCRLLYEHHLAAERWTFVVALDEAWVYLNNCDKKRSIYYKKRGEKNIYPWFKESKESYPKDLWLSQALVTTAS